VKLIWTVTTNNKSN